MLVSFSYDSRVLSIKVCNPHSSDIAFYDNLFLDNPNAKPAFLSLIFEAKNRNQQIKTWHDIYKVGKGDFSYKPTEALLIKGKCKVKNLNIHDDIKDRDSYSDEGNKVLDRIEKFKVSIILVGSTNKDGAEDNRLVISQWFNFEK